MDKPTRQQRNAALHNASPRMYQDTDPEPPARLSLTWWLRFVVLVLAITAGAGVIFWVVDSVIKGWLS